MLPSAPTPLRNRGFTVSHLACHKFPIALTSPFQPACCHQVIFLKWEADHVTHMLQILQWFSIPRRCEKKFFFKTKRPKSELWMERLLTAECRAGPCGGSLGRREGTGLVKPKVLQVPLLPVTKAKSEWGCCCCWRCLGSWSRKASDWMGHFPLHAWSICLGLGRPHASFGNIAPSCYFSRSWVSTPGTRPGVGRRM